MLVLARHINEGFIVGDFDVSVVEMDRNNGVVKLQISRQKGVKTISAAKGVDLQLSPDIIITAIKFDCSGVHMGIKAPKEINILRKEVPDRNKTVAASSMVTNPNKKGG